MITLKKNRLKLLLTISLCVLNTYSLNAMNEDMDQTKGTRPIKPRESDLTPPDGKLVITGGGIIGALTTYYAHKEATQKGRKLRVTINEKNKTIEETTACIILPSLTALETGAVIPIGRALVDKSKIIFSEPGGIRVDDVPGVQSAATTRFMEDAGIYSQDENRRNVHENAMLELGKFSMDQWQAIYDEADDTLKGIFERSNFNPCREPRQSTRVLHDGYRIDLLQKFPGAANQARNIRLDNERIGYQNCAFLSPQEVVVIDPFLEDFCKSRSTADGRWQDDAAAIWRPGGCLDASRFLPEFYEYMRKSMGQYTNKSGVVKDCFRLKFDREVVEVGLETYENQATIGGLRFRTGKVQINKSIDKTRYVFAPGESVGTLTRLGIKEPSYTGFAGVALRLNIPLSEEEIARYKNFNHCMEVHQDGVVLAWQARYFDGKIIIAGAGTKALYGEEAPTTDQAFAKTNNLIQLQMFNDVLPQFVSKALGRPTLGQRLTQEDMKTLEDAGIAKRSAGRRAVAYDGVITAGPAYTANGERIQHATITTHLGSGGVSSGPGAVIATLSSVDPDFEFSTHPVIQNILKYSQTVRGPNDK